MLRQHFDLHRLLIPEATRTSHLDFAGRLEVVVEDLPVERIPAAGLVETDLEYRNP